MTTPRTLTFDGCRTRHDAEAALRDYLRDIVADAERKLASDLLARDVDVDQVDGVIAAMDAAEPAATERAVEVFNNILDTGDRES